MNRANIVQALAGTFVGLSFGLCTWLIFYPYSDMQSIWGKYGALLFGFLGLGIGLVSFRNAKSLRALLAVAATVLVAGFATYAFVGSKTDCPDCPLIATDTNQI